MYHIGYVKLSEIEEEYIHSIKKECSVEEINQNISSQQLKTKDGIIIFSKNDEMICAASEVILKIREQSNAFIRIIAPQMNNISKVVFLQLGADGTFDDEQSLDILRLTIINALKRRMVEQQEKPERSNEEPPSFILDNRNQAIKIEGKPTAPLTNLEYRTLQLLADNLGNTVTYEEIYEAIWHQKYTDEKYKIANVMFHIRGKIEEDTSNPVYIKTVRSKGYLLCEV
ncbi:response regulator transcription factor [Enterococcus ureasiticus]|uniref:winged helix-turn-helix domain-containing protein n=1 Tax=Enterococcus ureasiticus TaxID=903984 RepID=UPI001A8CFD5C|nr:winged helix-turn-helix domain-containing protein [Enterococcus ureasiticus]MBO0473363.1 response regulator transcription factor [Enterococcus ureasiticus]